MPVRTIRAGLMAFIATGTPAVAITINDPFGPEGAAKLGAPFVSVARLELGEFGLCSGALISPTAILTARHCTDEFAAEDITVSFFGATGERGPTRGVSGITSLVGASGLEVVDEFFGNDISILSLLEAVTDFPPFRLLASPMVGEVARMVGFGDMGFGLAGVVPALGAGVRWAADNVVDGIVDAIPDTVLHADFDNPGGTTNVDLGDLLAELLEDPTLEGLFPSDPEMLPAEGLTAPGDSGGPLLFRRGDEWLIGGVALAVTGDSSYGNIAFWNGVSSPEVRALVEHFGGVYRPEPSEVGVDPAVIPLPASGFLLLAGLGALALRKRRG